MKHDVEISLNRLAWASLLPFIVTAILSLINLWMDILLPVFLVYSLVVLSFLGGIHWGLVIAGQLENQTRRLVLATLPALLGWASFVLLPSVVTLPILAAGHLLWLNYDLRQIPSPWYEKMRRPVTFVIAGSHFIWFIMVMTELRMVQG